MSAARTVIAVLLIFADLPFAAEGEIRGKVLDASTNQPIIGANVLAKGTAHGTATDLDGSFRFSTTANFPIVLEVSHISYQPISLTIDSLYDIEIFMTAAALSGEEITVSEKRLRSAGDVTSSVEIIDIEEFKEIGARDIGDIFRPLAAVRVDVTPFGRQEISIRGSNSNEIAVFLDGIRLNNAYSGVANLSSIDLSDIGQAEVVKGGNATLFGHGATGGAVSLTSQNPDKTTVNYGRSFGVSSDDDQDLTFAGSARLGPLAVGGRYSGKSRLYDGRTLFTSLYTIGSLALYPKSGEIVAKFNQLGNTISYSSGDILQGDSTNLASIYYRGSILGSRNWEISFGQREWTLSDRFFTNLTNNVSEKNLTYRFSKKMLRGPTELMAQVEGEDQTYTGDRVAYDVRTGVNTADDGRLALQDIGATLIGKWSTEVEHPLLDRVKFESSVRRDIITIEHDQHHIEAFQYDWLAPKVDSTFSTELNRRPKVLRIGAAVEGHTDRSTIEFYFNQGTNQRIPTLGDLFRFHGASIKLQEEPLVPERYNSLEVGYEIKDLKLKDVRLPLVLGLKVEVFQNSYVQKIAYQPVAGEPPIPFNKNSAQLRGYELTGKFHLWDGRVNGMIGIQHLSLSDALVFPNKPEDRSISQLNFELPWLLIRLDRQIERNLFIVHYGGISTNSHKRESVNANLILRWKYKRLKMSVAYKETNLNTDVEDLRDLDNESELPVNFFDVNRSIVTFRIEL